MRRKKYFFFILLCSFYSFLLPPSAQATSVSLPYEIIVSATIGEPKLTIFGYTSPQALVQLQGNRVSEQVIADLEGYFFFDRIFLPRPTPAYPELCLSTIDTQSRIGFPTCLSPLPVGPFDISVGPVLMPPTLTLEKGDFLPGEQITSHGATIPNSEVTIYFYNQESRKANSAKAREAWAYSLPKYEIQSDKNGSFEFSLPTARIAHWRLFASAQYFSSPTPKSNTLNFRVLSWWEWFLELLSNWLGIILGFFKPYWWLIVILLEIVILVFLLAKHKEVP